MILQKHAEKIVQFERLRRRLKTSFNDGLDRHLANLVHEEQLDLEGIKTKKQVVLSSLSLLVERTRREPTGFTNPEKARRQYEKEVQEIITKGIHPTGLLHLPDGFLPEWYLHTSPLNPAFKKFVEKNKRKILGLRAVR